MKGWKHPWWAGRVREVRKPPAAPEPVWAKCLFLKAKAQLCWEHWPHRVLTASVKANTVINREKHTCARRTVSSDTSLLKVTAGRFHSQRRTELAAPAAEPTEQHTCRCAAAGVQMCSSRRADVSQLPSALSRSDRTPRPGEPCATVALGLLTLQRTWEPSQKLQQVQEWAGEGSHPHPAGFKARWIWRKDGQDTAEHWKRIIVFIKYMGQQGRRLKNASCRAR